MALIKKIALAITVCIFMCSSAFAYQSSNLQSQDLNTHNFQLGTTRHKGPSSANSFKLSATGSTSTYAPSGTGVIGIKYLHRVGEMSTVMNVYHNTPAEAAGIRPGDRILEIDGVNITGFNADGVFSMIAGEPGQPVHMKLMRCNTHHGSHLGCHAYDVNLKRMDMNQIASDQIFRIYKYGEFN